MEKETNTFIRLIYIYRFDIVSLIIMFFLIFAFLSPIYTEGHVVFSDMAFGFSSTRYMEEIFGAWNERWSTATLFNVPRLLYILPMYLLSLLFGGSGPVLLKSFISVLILLSALSMYLFTKRLVSIYFTKDFNFFMVFALITGAIFYAVNPWVIFRIQHIYLLCGYSFFPLVLMFFFNVFDPRFQAQLIPNFNLYKAKLYKRNVIDLILLCIIFTISAAAIHYFFYGMIYLGMLGGLILIKTYVNHRKAGKKILWNIAKHFIVRIVAFGGLFAFFSSYWLSMYVGSILFKAQASQHNINVVDTLSLFSRNSTMENVIYFISYWWPMFNLESLPFTFFLGGGVLLLTILYAVVFRAYKDNIILFFTIVAIAFILLATGVTLTSFADIFVMIVTKTPIIGSMFRDPNKFIGLLAINYSVLITFGVVHAIRQLSDHFYHKVIKYGIVVIVIASFWLYIQPLHKQFIQGFYKPVDIPDEHMAIRDELIEPDEFDSKMLYFPIADNMTQSYTGVATPYWNENPNTGGFTKATGDVQVYSSLKNTIFHHEGNAMSITYYINYLQHLLDKGLSLNIASLFSAFGINELAYHDEYLGQETRQDFNKEILDEQDGLRLHYENDIYSLYELDENIQLPYLSEVPKKIFTPYGYSRLETFHSLPNFNFKDYGVIFTALSEDRYIDKANVGDYIEVNDYNDLLLSELPHENYLLPFEYIYEANAFLKWSKTLAKNNEWLWFLTSQNILNYPFDFDLGAGIGVTFATSKLDVLPYKMDEIEGDLIADFDSLLKMEKFFVPDNPQLFTIQSNPKSPSNEIPLLKGEIVKDDPKNIWQVAKSGLLEAKPNNPYQFKLYVSGRGTNKIHVKMRFYDENMTELGVSYVVAPSEEVNFDQLQFSGDYVSPADTKFMRMDILSFQRPEQKAYWWIHDMKLYDLEKYKAPNTITLKKQFDEATEARVFMRPLMNLKGGKLAVTFGDGIEHEVVTKSDSLNQFQWVDLGVQSFEQGENEIFLENVQGFNAVNMFAVIPLEDMEAIEFPIKRALEKANVFFTLEAENDLNIDGNLQSQRSYPKLSGGKGISLKDGTMEKTINIVKDSVYTIAINANLLPQYDGTLTVHLTNNETGERMSETISSKQFKQTNKEESIMIDYNPLNDSFPYEFRKHFGYYDHYETVTIPNLRLTKGEYTLTFSVESNIDSLSTFADIHKFSPSEIKEPDFVGDALVQDCCECVYINQAMMRDRSINDVFRVDYDPTCSCEWYIYASKKIPVNEYEEYLFNIEARSEKIDLRHMKVFFLNEESEIIETTFINDVEEKDKYKWNKYEQILKTPPGAKYMQLHIWTRGNKLEPGFLEMKNYSIVPYKDLILVDNIVVFEGNDLNTFLTAPSEKKVVTYDRVDTMKRTFTLENPSNERVLLNYIESPNPLWEMRYDESQRGTMVLNGVSTGFIVDGDGEGEIEVVLRKLYYIGLAGLLIGALLSFLFYRYLGKINRILKLD